MSRCAEYDLVEIDSLEARIAPASTSAMLPPWIGEAPLGGHDLSDLLAHPSRHDKSLGDRAQRVADRTALVGLSLRTNADRMLEQCREEHGVTGEPFAPHHRIEGL